MEGIANFISMLDYVLDTKRKRHITGGLLLSGALLFGGLATVTYSDVNRVQLINKESPDIPFRNGFGTRLIDKMYPITLPYFPADKKFKIIVEEFLTDEKNGDFDTVGYLQLILPNGEVVDLNGYFKDGPDGMVRIEQAEYEERKANRIDKK